MKTFVILTLMLLLCASLGYGQTTANISDSTPAAPAGKLNVKWQKDSSTPPNISGYLETKRDILDASGSCADVGGTDSYACTLSPAITAYVTGISYRFKANTANTGVATINLNSLGAITIKKKTSGITTDLADNDVRAGAWVVVVYDGTNMQCVGGCDGNAVVGGGVNPGSGYAIASYPTGVSSVLSAINVTSDATGNNFIVPGTLAVNGCTWSVSGGVISNSCDLGLAQLLPNTPGAAAVGSTSLPWSGIYIGNLATNNILITGVATAARQVNLPDATTYLPVASQYLTWTGPTASRTYTLPDADATLVTSASGTFTTLTDAATITWAIGSSPVSNAQVTLGGNRTLNITNPVNGGNYVLKIIQDGGGSKGLTLGTGCSWKIINGGAGSITPTTTAGATDILAFTYDGANCYATLGKNYN